MPQKIQALTGTDAEGKPIYSEMEVPTAEEIAALQAAVTKANNEAAKKRHQYNDLKSKLQSVETTDEDSDEQEEGSDEPEQVTQPKTKQTSKVKQPLTLQPVDEDAIVAKAVERIDQRDAERKAAGRAIDDLMTKHKLNPVLRETLANSKDPAAEAARLEQAGLTFAGSDSGRGSGSKKQKPVKEHARAAFESLNLDPSVLDDLDD